MVGELPLKKVSGGTKLREEEGDPDARSRIPQEPPAGNHVGAAISLQPVERTTPEQMSTMQPVERTMPKQVEMPQRNCPGPHPGAVYS